MNPLDVGLWLAWISLVVALLSVYFAYKVKNA